MLLHNLCNVTYYIVYSPIQIKGDFLHQSKKATDEEISAFKRQAAIDWECFLLHRARELKPGILKTLVQCYFCTPIIVTKTRDKLYQKTFSTRTLFSNSHIECLIISHTVYAGGQLVIASLSYLETCETSHVSVISDTWKSFADQNIIKEVSDYFN